MSPPSDDHDCGWRSYAVALQGDVEKLKAELDALKRQVFGKKSEKMPPMERELRRGKKADPAETLRKRKETALTKEELVTEQVTLPVPESQRCCPHCQQRDLRPVGEGKVITVYDYVPGHFRRKRIARETLACRCGQYIVTAPGPDKATDKTQYGPGFVAHLITQKCAQSTPFYRLEKEYRWTGIPIARSTMTDLFHRHAELLSPLVKRLLARIAASDVVLADETSVRMLGTTKKAYLWTFIAGNDIGYVFSPDRSGDTPARILGSSQGILVVDAYTGYNSVTSTGGRKRAGCLAHVRRKFYDAFAGDTGDLEAKTALDLIHDIYVVEHEAKELELIGTAEHLELRRTRSRPLLAKLFWWARQERGRHLPKGKMGRAISYLLNNRRALTRFTTNVRVPVDNNRSEGALRVVALGRKNFLYIGSKDAGNNIAGLYSLVATCIAYGKNPIEYLTDVLLRINSCPLNQLDELLPHRWRAAPD